MVASEIEKVVVRIYRTDVLSYHAVPKNAVDAQFNLPYAVAVALLRGALTLSDFTTEAIDDVSVLAIASRIEVREDAEFTSKYPDQYLIELTLAMRDGSERRVLSECPSGDPEAPRYAGHSGRLMQEVEEKVRSVLQETGFGNRADALIRAAAGLWDASDVSALTALIGRVEQVEQASPAGITRDISQPGRGKST